MDHAIAVTAAQCRQLADYFKARAKETGGSQKRATLLANISRSFSCLAHQLEMLDVDVVEERRK